MEHDQFLLLLLWKADVFFGSIGLKCRSTVNFEHCSGDGTLFFILIIIFLRMEH